MPACVVSGVPKGPSILGPPPWQVQVGTTVFSHVMATKATVLLPFCKEENQNLPFLANSKYKAGIGKSLCWYCALLKWASNRFSFLKRQRLPLVVSAKGLNSWILPLIATDSHCVSRATYLKFSQYKMGCIGGLLFFGIHFAKLACAIVMVKYNRRAGIFFQ